MPKLSRLLTGSINAFIFCSLLSLMMIGLSALAAAPEQKGQSPGFYRIHVGEIEVTALNDGTFAMPVGKLLKDISPAVLDADLQRAFLSDPVEASVNGYLINTGAKLVLIDTGAGALFGPTLGKLTSNLRAAGYSADQVDEIYITHLHGDHVGGLIANGKAVFKNAIVRIAQAESDYWLDPKKRDAATEEAKSGFVTAMTALAPYIAEGRLKPFSSDAVLATGIRAQKTAGHTPGHSAYVVESKGHALLLWGDLMHVAAVQFNDPTVTIGFDTDSTAAKQQRSAVFTQVSEKAMLVGGAHLSFPGLGHLRPVGSGYEFVPVNYTASP